LLSIKISATLFLSISLNYSYRRMARIQADMERLQKDISERKDIELLVDRFYAKVRKDDVIGYIFNDVMAVHWDSHIPRIVNFWEAVLFRRTQFDGNPLQKHLGVDKKERLDDVHFQRWLKLFHETVDELFTGEIADAAKYRSKNIAGVFMEHLEKHRSAQGFTIDPLS
jgi:hemoglobin